MKINGYEIKSGVNLRSANLSGANLSGADLSSADLICADLRGVNLRDAYLRDANLSGAYLHGADLSGANLHGANLSSADLHGANLSDANLRSANLSGAYLRSAYLSDAYLRSADLSDANLRSADLSGANLSGADLSDANLSGVFIDKNTKGLNNRLSTPLSFLYHQKCKIILYKLVNDRYTTTHHPKFVYRPGSVIKEDYYSKDINSHCDRGISLGTAIWVRDNYDQGDKIMSCEFKVEDIVCIPNGSLDKIRVKYCKVIDELDPKEFFGETY